MADVGVFGRYKGFSDFQEAAKKNNLAEALAGAQIQSAQAALIKAQRPDIGKLGESGFLKAAQGIEPLPEEVAGMRYLDAKTGGMQFDPVTGNAMQKPSLLDKIPLPANKAAATINPVATKAAPRAFSQAMTGGAQPVGTGDFLADIAPMEPLPDTNEYDQAYEEQMRLAEGNPKLQQQIRADFAKDKFNMTEAQTKAAGFADRMAASLPVIEAKTSAGLSPVNRYAKDLPLIGNIVIGSDARSFNQAQRDFINAQLRRESGAVINPDEFVNAAQQYFPQVGDDENVLALKKANREAAFGGMKRSAGPAYKAPDIKVPVTPKDKKRQFNARKAEKAGLTPEEYDELNELRKRFKK